MISKEKWLEVNLETALDPELPICDPHHHLWVKKHNFFQETYLLPDFLRDIESGHNIVSTVFVECGALHSQDRSTAENNIAEVEFVNGIAAMSQSGLFGGTKVAAGIVGSAPLLEGKNVARILDRQIEINPERLKGVRAQAAMHPDGTIPSGRSRPPQSVYLNDTFHQGFAELASRNLSFEAWCYHPQIPELTQLARKFPNTVIILNHFGGPLGVGSFAGKANEVFESWRSSISELSKCPNVVAKLGGIAMELNGFEWHKSEAAPNSTELYERTRPFYETTLEYFGTERCMFESNFPVDKISCSYVNLWNSFKLLTKNYSTAERTLLFHDTASRIYKLST